MQEQYTIAEKAELALIHEILTKIRDTSDDELGALALDEMDRKQPALQNLARFLYMQKKFSIEQMMEITRLLAFIWLYYKDRLKVPNIKIADPLYNEMRKKHEALLAGMEGGKDKHSKQILEDHLKVYPARFLYGQVHQAIFIDKSNSLSAVAKADKAFLLSNLKIIMDCFETLVDRSATLSHFN